MCEGEIGIELEGPGQMDDRTLVVALICAVEGFDKLDFFAKTVVSFGFVAWFIGEFTAAFKAVVAPAPQCRDTRARS